MHCKFLKIKAFAKYINGNTNGFMAEKLTNTFKKKNFWFCAAVLNIIILSETSEI